MRDIDALAVWDRTQQKCFCLNYLTKLYTNSFIYDNSASTKGKGSLFTMNRLRYHLHNHYRKYGCEGGILQFDFKSYFLSIPHNKIKERAKTKMKDEKLYKLFCQWVDDFRLLKIREKED